MNEYLGGRERRYVKVNDKERNDTKMATLYELRLAIDKSSKEEYTKEEILEFLDTVAAKDQK